ncbi:unnamed protein product [Brassicogethes aeneus]|uniref:Beta-galactosidase n=1 Tax=Brassicogethes aeneus TaxID=1431903 RepID=A0A9P0BHW0_BRAAE|nr:unnamed protein product [Brassicogethes aeneus]
MVVSMEASPLPSLYQHYTQGEITSGLSTQQPYFTLNGRNISIYSGAVHYFRVPPEYWRDRLRKMRHAGLNTVETYVPWNLHEPEPGKYDFGNGGTDWQDFLNLEKFLKTAQEEDLLAIIRPGPFICAEWEFGGFPSWLLREKNIKVRTSDANYMKHVTRFFNALLPILAALQFTSGGPIIAFQVENEYGSSERMTSINPFQPDLNYVQDLINLMKSNGIKELLFSSDNSVDHGTRGTIPSELFQTANFNKNPEQQFDMLKMLQPNRPSMCMEFWAGWFDHWFEKHYVGNVSNFKDVYERILKYPASVNLYMFHGGTSFGFLNGANIKGKIDQPFAEIQRNFQPDITSYDYDAPLTEYGDYNLKYFVVKELIEQYNPVKTRLPEFVTPLKLVEYKSISTTDFMGFHDVLSHININCVIISENIVPMEFLNINNNTGQSFGYVIYRKNHLDLNKTFTLKFDGYVYDAATVYVNGKLISKKPNNLNDLDGFGFYRQKNAILKVNLPVSLKNATLEIMVENMGRNNFGQLEWFTQLKGLHNNFYINNQEIKNYEILPLEFKKSFTSTLSWKKQQQNTKQPGLHKAILPITKKFDTFLDMKNWTWGIVIINGFILGRYNNLGPQKSLYLPAPLLNIGNNEILVFENYEGSDNISFSGKPIFNL